MSYGDEQAESRRLHSILQEGSMTAPRTEPACRHVLVTRYSNNGSDPMLWSCDDCKRRFYPACPTCIDVGHRGEVHVEAAALTPGALDVERLAQAMRIVIGYPVADGGWSAHTSKEIADMYARLSAGQAEEE